VKLFGFTIPFTEKAAVTAMSVANSQGLVPIRLQMQGQVLEHFGGAWQRGITLESRENILAFSAVFACIALISDDVAKLRVMLTERDDDGVWDEVEFGSSAFLPVLRKPNRYQTRIQFLRQWVTQKLMYGNNYVLLQRDQRRVVEAMYNLDPRLVTPLVAPDGEVFYRLNRDDLNGVPIPVEIPASEIIHDRMYPLFHPLMGVSPIYACAATATQGIRIQANSEKFFSNMSRPSGQLTAPGTISPETAARLKTDFEANFSGSNIGRLLVTGDGLKYEPMTIPANDAQLIEQLQWTVSDVARCFKVPLHKLDAGTNPTFSNVGALNQDYYSNTLQAHIEDIELLLDEALGLPRLGMGTELDLEGLLRMDPKSRAETTEIEMRSAVITPDEARLKENRHPVEGGDTPYMQQQNYSLAALAKRDAKADPFGTDKPPVAPPAVPTPTDDEEKAYSAMRTLIDKLNKAAHAEPV
jgi:HK97 family phage portal protein